MTRMRRRLLEDYIIPALNSGKYRHKLYWLDKEQGIFRLYWSHKNAAKWTTEDTIVFQDWDRLKGHFKPEGEGYFMSAKQRFRAALYKLKPHVTPLKISEKIYRDYQLVLDGKEKPAENLVRTKTKSPKRINQRSIPTSVIRKNTSYIAKPTLDDGSKTPSSPSPPCQPLNNEQIFFQYNNSMKKLSQLKMGRHYEKRSLEEVPRQSPPREVHETSVLRENSSTPRTPHVSPQVVPVYYSHKRFKSHHHHLQVCPDVFISKNYTGPENIPQMRDDSQSSVYTTDEDDDANSGILNLSVRSEASSNAPSR